MEKFKIALVGNTNAGKTTFINTICGLNQETSNYPGTTVEFFEAKIKHNSQEYKIIDLPGVYNLTPFSDEEKVTRKILQEEKFDLVVQIIEPHFKKRSLVLTLELMELDLPLFIVVNNKSNVWRHADCFLQNLKEKFGIEGISINAFKKETKNQFFDKITESKLQKANYRKVLDKVHFSLKSEIEYLKEKLKSDNLWAILKILEQDAEIIEKYKKTHHVFLNKNLQKDVDYNLEIKNNRFNYIEHHLLNCWCFDKKNKKQRNFHQQQNQSCAHFISDKIDRLFLSKWLGIPIFLVFMWLTFQTTFMLGAIPMNLIDGFIGFTQEKLVNILPKNLWSSVLIDGVIGGVGATLVFLPPIFLLFFFLSVLQQSGYLARVAYLLDNLMQKIGLGGKSFVPLLMGFGCSVPAIMATRTLISRKEKIITSLMVPFMSCGAKLPVYTLFISAFFPEKYRGSILFALYIFGILMGILSGLFFNKLIKESKCHLLLELPAYTVPKLKNVLQAIWRAIKEFLYKAGRVILPLSIVLWFLFSFPIVNNKNVSIENSYAAQIGKTIEPIFAPLGFDWRISTGLVAGLGAKEVFISTFGTMYSLEDDNEIGLIDKLQNDSIFTPLTVISLLIFVLIYAPCIAVIGILKQEFGWKWAMVGLMYPTVLAWTVSFIFYQIGMLFFLKL